MVLIFETISLENFRSLMKERGQGIFFVEIVSEDKPLVNPIHRISRSIGKGERVFFQSPNFAFSLKDYEIEDSIRSNILDSKTQEIVLENDLPEA